MIDTNFNVEEVLVNGNYVNPAMVYGKELTDLTNEK